MSKGDGDKDEGRTPRRRPIIYGSVFGTSSERLANIIRRRNQGLDFDDELAEGDNQQQIFLMDDQMNRNNDEVVEVDESNEPVDAEQPPAEEERAESPVVVAEEAAAANEKEEGEQGESSGSASFNYNFNEDRFLDDLRSHDRQGTSSQANNNRVVNNRAEGARVQRTDNTVERDVQCVVDSQDASTQVILLSRNVSVATVAVDSRDVGVQSSVDVENHSIGVQTQVDTQERATQYDAPPPTSIREVYNSCFHNKGFMEGFYQGISSADAYMQRWRMAIQSNPLDLLTPDVAARSLTSYMEPPNIPPHVVAGLLNQDVQTSNQPPLVRNLPPFQQLAVTHGALVNRNLFAGVDYSNLNLATQRQYDLLRQPSTPFLFNPNLHQTNPAFWNQHAPIQNVNLFSTSSGTPSLLQPNFAAQMPPVQGAPSFPNNFASFDGQQAMMAPEQGLVDSPNALQNNDVLFLSQNQNQNQDVGRMTPAQGMAVFPNVFSTFNNAVTVNQDNADAIETMLAPESVPVSSIIPDNLLVLSDSGAPDEDCTAEKEIEEIPVSRQNSSEDRPATPEIFTPSGRPLRACQATRMAVSSENRVTNRRRRSASTVSTSSAVSPPKKRSNSKTSSASKKQTSSKKPVARKSKNGRKGKEKDDKEEKGPTTRSKKILENLRCSSETRGANDRRRKN